MPLLTLSAFMGVKRADAKGSAGEVIMFAQLSVALSIIAGLVAGGRAPAATQRPACSRRPTELSWLWSSEA